ncbi:MAG: hypothetical protein H8E72_09915, partial [Candidatus Marinimicrobia bacterium]|nr:hypothetical protein [Candidatus Neomarinimicrobiota bacterium]
MDDIGQPYSCQQWGDRGVVGKPTIINDGDENIIYNWFDYDGAYPDNVFIDHEMREYYHQEGYMSVDGINTIIQEMLNNIPCYDPIALNFGEPGECDYTNVFTSYETDIQPIFDNNCTQCHGSSGGLSLANYDDLMSGSVVSANDGENSTIYERMISTTSPMPPNGLIDVYLAERIKAWIDQGASQCAQGEDCAGVCGGDSVEDMCQNCDSDSTNDCVQDCNGDWGGSLVNDECGICGGDNSTCTDCNGVINGNSWESNCGCVVEENTGNDCDDCFGIPNGISIDDECGICGGDNSTCTDC